MSRHSPPNQQKHRFLRLFRFSNSAAQSSQHGGPLTGGSHHLHEHGFRWLHHHHRGSPEASAANTATSKAPNLLPPQFPGFQQHQTGHFDNSSESSMGNVHQVDTFLASSASSISIGG
ncbi:unnamed protein product [Mesocestoides corti]|uniref:Uncharacterized protein n=1 Tax=Mesocestoides corti TaxID=53468 RepID=A0A0R3UJV7_MESCO|nr:unnamed protein product [Mesocestoides corti]